MRRMECHFCINDCQWKSDDTQFNNDEMLEKRCERERIFVLAPLFIDGVLSYVEKVSIFSYDKLKLCEASS
jgi:hypothetical protein